MLAMTTRCSRRTFVKVTALASAAGPLTLEAGQAPAAAGGPAGAAKAVLPLGRIGNVEFSRLLLGGNLITGYAHARELAYVGPLMKRYNTEAKVLETLELAETHGINAINSAVWDDIQFLRAHWKRGGKMKWIAQALPTQKDLLAQFKQAIDLGAAAVHVQGHGAERCLKEGRLDDLAKIVAYLKSQKVPAGIAAHSQRVIVECVRAKMDVDFFQKTFHSLDYPSAPRSGQFDEFDLGRYDNCWCRDPEEIAEFMQTVRKPWIAFKVLAAGAISPHRGFQFALDHGADFLLVGMFDWQIAGNVQTFKEALARVNRSRPWQGQLAEPG